MFDFGVGYSEIFVLALIAIIVIGPKDLPKVLRAFGKTMAKVRGMAGEFQGHVDQAMKEAGLDDVKKDLQALKVGSPMSQTKSTPSIAAPPKSNDFDEYFGPADQDGKAKS
jgi:sec-independent protein translocase protein TatB